MATSNNLDQNLVFTNHALARLSKRSMTKKNVYLTVTQPDQKFISQEETREGDQETVKFVKTVNQRNYQVVAQFLAKENKWLIISVWVRGEEDPVPWWWRVIRCLFKRIKKLLILCYKTLIS